MPANFTETEKEQIRMTLLEAGFSMGRSEGLKGMTVEKLARRCGIAKGTFYHFYESKEAFVAALFAENGRRNQAALEKLMDGREKITLEEFLRWYRSLFTYETNFSMNLRTADYIWLKAHLRDYGYFHPEEDSKKAKLLLEVTEGVRPDFDPAVVVNFIKGIYAMTSNRDSFCEKALPVNIDLIFSAIYHYVKEP